MRDLVDLLHAASYYQFDIEFSGTGQFRIVMPDETASEFSPASAFSIVDAIAFVVTNSRRKPSE